jgi:hypothetical protein
VPFGTNRIVVAKVHDLRIAGRLTKPGAPAFEGVRDVLEEEKARKDHPRPQPLTPESGSMSLADLPKNIRQRDALHLRNGQPGA